MKLKTNFSIKQLLKLTFCLALLFGLTFNLQAKNIYVSAQKGKDTNPGTIAEPLKRLNDAMARTESGDVVYVMAGKYNTWNQETCQNCAYKNASLLWITKSGSPGKPITYRVNPGDEGKVILQNHKSESAIHVNGADHIIIDGFKIVGQAAFVKEKKELKDEYEDLRRRDLACGNKKDCPNQTCRNDIDNCRRNVQSARNTGVGIMVQSENHGDVNPAVNVIIRNCNISMCTGSGIAVNKTAKVIIEGNTVYENAKYSKRGTSGISVFRPVDCNGKCTDFSNTKDNKYSIIIRGNRVYKNDNLFECDCDEYESITDGNGIIIDQTVIYVNGAKVYSKEKFLVENNIVHGNGGKGIHVFESNNVDIINNSLYNNGSRASLFAASDISSDKSKDVKIYNNLTNPVSNINSIHITNSSNVIVARNVHAKGIVNEDSNAKIGSNRKGFPHYNPDYSLKSTSPAINFGNSNYVVSSKDFSGNKRIIGPSVDAGAREFVGNPTQPQPETCGEKLENPNFDIPNTNKIPDWKVFSGGTAKMNGFINQWGVAKFNITKTGENYNLQFWQDGLKFEPNTWYEVNVLIRADKEREARMIVRPAVFPNGEPFYYKNEILKFGSTFTAYTHRFKSGSSAETNARLSFLIGDDNTNVYIDKVSLKKVCNNKLSSTNIASPQLANIYPNPASDYVNIQLYENIETAKITIFDIQGKLVQTQTIRNSGETSVDVSKLETGSYFIRIQSGDAIETQKLLKD